MHMYCVRGVLATRTPSPTYVLCQAPIRHHSRWRVYDVLVTDTIDTHTCAHTLKRTKTYLVAGVKGHLRQQLAIAYPGRALPPHVLESPRPRRQHGHQGAFARRPLDDPAAPAPARQELLGEIHRPPELIYRHKRWTPTTGTRTGAGVLTGVP